MNTIKILFPIKNKLNPTEEESLAALKAGMEKLVKIGALKGNLDDIVKDYQIEDGSGYAKAIVDQDALCDPAKLNTLGAAMSMETDYQVEVDDTALKGALDELKTFSAQTITERLRLFKAQPKVRLRYMIMDYRRFYKAKQKMIESNLLYAKQLRNMFITDLMGIFNEILPYIQEGKQLNMLLGLSTVTKNMNRVARDLSMAYKRALKSQASTGQIPKNMFKNLQTQYNIFITELVDQVMPGLNEFILKSENPEAVESSDNDKLTNQRVAASLVKSFSKNNMPVVVVESSNPTQVAKILNAIGKCGNGGHSFEIVIDPDMSEADGGNIKFGWDGDGSDRIGEVRVVDELDKNMANDIEKFIDETDPDDMSEKAKEFSYQYTESGRIKLF